MTPNPKDSSSSNLPKQAPDPQQTMELADADSNPWQKYGNFTEIGGSYLGSKRSTTRNGSLFDQKKGSFGQKSWELNNRKRVYYQKKRGFNMVQPKERGGSSGNSRDCISGSNLVQGSTCRIVSSKSAFKIGCIPFSEPMCMVYPSIPMYIYLYPIYIHLHPPVYIYA